MLEKGLEGHSMQETLCATMKNKIARCQMQSILAFGYILALLSDKGSPILGS